MPLSCLIKNKHINNHDVYIKYIVSIFWNIYFWIILQHDLYNMLAAMEINILDNGKITCSTGIKLILITLFIFVTITAIKLKFIF